MPSSRSATASVSLAVALSASISTLALAQGVETARNSKTGLVGWMSIPSGGAASAAAPGAGGAVSFEQAALEFLGRESASFGLRSGAAEVTATKTSEDGDGNGFVRVQQTYKGVPIVGAELVVQLNGARSVTSVNGRSVGDVEMSTEPSVKAEDARRSAIATTARAHDVSVMELTGSDPVLAVHDPRVMGGPPAPAALVWRVAVTAKNRPEIDEFVLIDAQNGRVAVQFNQTPHAVAPANAKQLVCDAANSTNKLPCTPIDAVAKPGASAVPDVKLAFNFAEKTYDFYARRFNRNSLDDKGLTLISTVRWQQNAGSDLANAFWSSQLGQMIYGKDYATAEDVVGHELTHGFTSFSSKLFYYYQSGALNESLSDIFGELVQRTTDKTDGWLLGEDLPIGAVRNMKDPTASPSPAQPDKMTSTLWEGDFTFRDRGGVHFNSGVGNKTAYLITDGDTFNGQTVRGLGINKTAALFYRVNAFLLTSSSDYADLANALKQSCQDLLGKQPLSKDGKPTAAFTSSDCRQVNAAIAATELYKQPQYWPIPAEAAVCPSNQVASTTMFENFEQTDTTKFKYQPSDTTHWGVADFYAASNIHSIAGFGSGQFDTNLAQKTGLKIPANAYLRFAHFHNLRYNFEGKPVAGGIVEYTLGNNRWVRVPASMFLDNPYNATLANSGVLAGQKAFGGFSGGWTSSRINLASFAGKTVKFRFRVGTDSLGAGDGWYLDDIRVYTCKAASTKVAATGE